MTTTTEIRLSDLIWYLRDGGWSATPVETAKKLLALPTASEVDRERASREWHQLRYRLEYWPPHDRPKNPVLAELIRAGRRPPLASRVHLASRRVRVGELVIAKGVVERAQKAVLANAEEDFSEHDFRLKTVTADRFEEADIELDANESLAEREPSRSRAETPQDRLWQHIGEEKRLRPEIAALVRRATDTNLSEEERLHAFNKLDLLRRKESDGAQADVVRDVRALEKHEARSDGFLVSRKTAAPSLDDDRDAWDSSDILDRGRRDPFQTVRERNEDSTNPGTTLETPRELRGVRRTRGRAASDIYKSIRADGAVEWKGRFGSDIDAIRAYLERGAPALGLSLAELVAPRATGYRRDCLAVLVFDLQQRGATLEAIGEVIGRAKSSAHDLATRGGTLTEQKPDSKT